MNKLDLNVLSINAYGIDIPSGEDKVFSGAIARQRDYTAFLNKYHIITPTAANGEREAVELGDGLRIYPIPVIGRFEFMRKTMLKAGELIEQEKIDVVVADNPFVSGYLGVSLKKKYGVKLIIHSMAEMIDNPYYLGERIGNRFKNWLAKRNLADTDILRVSTRAELNNMQARGIDPNLLHYVPFYIDFGVFEEARRDEAFKRELVGDDFKHVILFIGRIAKQKNIPTLVRAAEIVVKKHPDALFVIIGDGPESDRTKNIISHMGLEKNVRLVGKVPYGDVVRYYKAADLFAISSIYEGTCMVLLEAGICGLPVVSTDFAGAQDYITDGVNGFLAGIMDHEAMADKIAYILEHAEVRKRMGEAAMRITREQFGREQALVLYREMFEKILKILHKNETNNR